MPMKWLPENPVWKNFQEIWTKIPLLLFFKNSFKLAIIITALQVLTSSFAAYPFAKMKFPGKDLIFLCYIATIAVPWQVYMVPQFIPDPENAAGRYAFVPDSDAGIYGVWSILNETVLPVGTE